MEIKLDFSIPTSEERAELVQKIIDQTPREQLTKKYLEKLADYIIFSMDKEQKKEKKILTENRLATVSKRETSFEGVCSKLENGEDGIYNLMSDLGKNIRLVNKDPITEKDVAANEDLRALKEAIENVEAQYEQASGKRKYLLKKQLIEMRQDQYIIRQSDRKSWGFRPPTAAKFLSKLDLSDKYSFDEHKKPINDGVISFFNPKHIALLLCNYPSLREFAEKDVDSDLWFMLEDFDALVKKALAENPLYQDLLIAKMSGKSNLEIQRQLAMKHHVSYSIEHLSALWRQKIPKIIAKQAEDDYIIWYYTHHEEEQWKTCSKCGQKKPAHNNFFSRNKTSRDGFYSICKDCRNHKTGGKK